MTFPVKASPLAHQRPMLESRKRFKILPCGRRSGKTRGALIAITTGHGPDREWKGLIHGGVFSWIAPDVPQARDVWREEMVPRFRKVPGVKISRADKTITLPNGGYLEIRSMENIDSVRGGGLDGVVFDEAAHMDLQYGWENVVRAKLADRQGWAMFCSTTNAGLDGNTKHIAPSYFNRLVALADKQELSDDWGRWHWTIYDNPLIPRDEIEEIKRDLGGDTNATWQQEYLANLIFGGAGQAFPEWKDEVHTVPHRRTFPNTWEFFGSLDWGYRQGHFGVWGVSTEGDVELCWEYYEDFREKDARTAATEIARAAMIFPPLRAIHYDNQMDQNHGMPGNITLHDEFTRGWLDAVNNDLSYVPVMTPTTKGKNSRVEKKNAMHAFLAYKTAPNEQGAIVVPPWGRPKLRAQAHCQGFIQCMKTLPLDPARPDDVDTKAVDHPYDSACMLLITRPSVPREELPFVSQNKNPGIDAALLRKRHWENMGDHIREQQQQWVGNGYQYPRASDLREIT